MPNANQNKLHTCSVRCIFQILYMYDFIHAQVSNLHALSVSTNSIIDRLYRSFFDRFYNKREKYE